MVALACWLAILATPALVWRFAPGPVRLNLRATVLWLPWYLLACTLLPALLGGLAGELATVLAGVYLLPFGCLAIGMSLGKRHGLCPLFPVACALCLLIVVGPGISYRHLTVWEGGSTNVELTPPHDISDKKITDHLPKGDGADTLLEMMKRSEKILREHPVNKKRVAEGKNPATSIWVWGEGTKPQLDNFEEKFGFQIHFLQ